MYDLIESISYYDGDDYYLKDLDDSLISKVRLWRNVYYLVYKYNPRVNEDELLERDEAWLQYCDRDLSVKTEFTLKQIDELKESVNRCFNLNGHYFDIRPTFSSGATAERTTKLSRRLFLDPHMAGSFAGSAMGLNDWRQYLDTLRCTELDFSLFTKSSRFSTVPKDSRGPRAICMEPASRLAFQLGLMKDLYDWIENYSPAKGYVNFTDQTVNQRMSYRGSINRHWATIDLKDASDMVSNELVKAVMPEPLSTYLQELRSQTVEYGATTIELRKYASMGSALCFPVEAMVFYAIARLHCAMCFVYGDDIIVPTTDAQKVIQALTDYGLKVNVDKTFSSGLFRESCGTDWYNGRLVTPVRLRGFDLDGITSFLTLWEEAYGSHMGLLDVIQSMDIVKEELTSHGLNRVPVFPLEYSECGAVAFYSKDGKRPKIKFPPPDPTIVDYHYPLIRALVPSTEADNIITTRTEWDQYDELYCQLVGIKGQLAKYTASIFSFTVKSSSEYLYDMINRIEYNLTLRKTYDREIDPIIQLLKPTSSVSAIGDVRNKRLIWRWLPAKTESLW